MIVQIALLPLADAQLLPPPMTEVVSAGAIVGLPEILLAAMVALVFLFLVRPERRRRVSRPSRSGGRPGLRKKAFRPRGKALRPGGDRNWILVDGSNVMHWEDNTPQIEPVRLVVTALKARGLDPGVVFDANAGWKLFGRYLGERELCQLVDLPQDQVLVVPKGSPADPWLLTTARDYGARIVSNDRFRDWAEDHPEVTTPGFLIHGGLTGGGVWLEGMPEPRPPVSA